MNRLRRAIWSYIARAQEWPGSRRCLLMFVCERVRRAVGNCSGPNRQNGAWGASHDSRRTSLFERFDQRCQGVVYLKIPTLGIKLQSSASRVGVAGFPSDRTENQAATHALHVPATRTRVLQICDERSLTYTIDRRHVTWRAKLDIGRRKVAAGKPATTATYAWAHHEKLLIY